MIIITPDKFKGSLPRIDVSEAMYKAVTETQNKFSCKIINLSDGGEGTAEILGNYYDAEKIIIKVNNAIFNPINAEYYINFKNKIAFIDFSEASGFKTLSGKKLNPINTSSYGTGELILDAVNKGAENIYLCLGGSSTNDAGIGLATALGYKFYNNKGIELLPTGKNLIEIYDIDNSKVKFDLSKINFTALCDVDNPLYGKNGAAQVFAKQKGANPKEIKLLDEGLENFSTAIKRKFNKNISKISYGGAAGGAGAGIFIFLNAKLKSGIKTVIKLTDYEKQIKNADLIISGEGKLDKQTLSGKLIKGISNLTLRYNIKFGVVCGSSILSKKDVNNLNIKYLETINESGKNFNLNKKTTFDNIYILTKSIITDHSLL